jgi:hypothetical protein
MSSTLIAELNYASVQVNRYLSIVFLCFGIIGNILSCVVFAQRTVRLNPCVIYFLIASVSNVIVLITGIPPRMLSSWNILADQTETQPVLCKLRLIVLFTTRTITAWLLVLATIDRYLVSSSNANLRRMSNMKQVFRGIIIVCCGSVIFWAESIYCFDANLKGTPIKCYAKSEGCRVFNDLSQAFVTTIIPSGFMLVFGLCTVNNIRQARRVRPTMMNSTVNNVTRTRRNDNSLTQILFIQVIILTVFNLPQAIQKFYLTYTFYQSKSTVQIAIENLLFNIVLILTYVANCSPFYLYILTSDYFRRTFFETSRAIIRRLKCTT